MPRLDLEVIGKLFGKLTVLGEYRRRENSNTTQWKCSCECGKVTWVDRDKLLSGHTKSCGCIVKKYDGLSNEKLYKTWWAIKERCYKPSYNKSYKNYGGRGIKMCDEWFDFLVFNEWAKANGYTESLTIDRIDENKDYCPENCQWITLSENVSRSNKTTPRNLIKFMYYGISPAGEYIEFSNASTFAKENNMNANGLRRAARGERNHYKNWKFGFTDKPNIDRR